MNAFLKHDELRSLCLEHASDGDPGPCTDDLGDLIFSHLFAEKSLRSDLGLGWGLFLVFDPVEQLPLLHIELVETMVIRLGNRLADGLSGFNFGIQLFEFVFHLGEAFANLLDVAASQFLSFPLFSQAGQFLLQERGFILDVL